MVESISFSGPHLIWRGGGHTNGKFEYYQQKYKIWFHRVDKQHNYEYTKRKLPSNNNNQNQTKNRIKLFQRTHTRSYVSRSKKGILLKTSQICYIVNIFTCDQFPQVCLRLHKMEVGSQVALNDGKYVDIFRGESARVHILSSWQCTRRWKNTSTRTHRT